MAREAGLPVEIVTGGSTGTYNIDSERKGLTELQAGSFVFMDTLYRQVGGKHDHAVYTDFGPALTGMTTRISARHPHQCTIDPRNKALLNPTAAGRRPPRAKLRTHTPAYGTL